MEKTFSDFRALSQMSFDSEVFGFPFFRVNLGELKVLAEEIERMKEHTNEKFGCDAKTDLSQIDEFTELKQLGFRHVCDQTTSEATNGYFSRYRDTGIIIKDTVEEELVAAHAANFTNDRLSLDPRIPVETTKRFYAQWIRNASAIPEKKTYALDSGLCITLEKHGVLKIDLVSVLEKRSGIGSRLLDHILSKARKYQFEKFEVTTESNNEGALRLYQKSGFRKVSEHHCLHFLYTKQ